MNVIVRGLGVPGLALTALLALNQALAAQPPAATLSSPTAAVAVQQRGPIHEAFAQPTDTLSQPGPVIPTKPPDPVPEQPPDEKPQADVQWLPGYWAWDDDGQRFVWVSGFWRVPPPDRRWVPGYWAQVAGGWQWVPGAWIPLNQDQLSYLPSGPPASLENGPSIPPPGSNSIYIPGCWLSGASGYAWQPGYWSAARPGFVWTPPAYCSTPAGYLYVNGYWDYPLANRGFLFAPVAFNQPLWQNPSWVYQPSYGIGTAGLLSSLFVRPGWGHYYYGNYYGPRYAQLGYRPWLNYGSPYRNGLHNYYRWANRGNPGWYRGLVNGYRGRAAGTLPAQVGLVRPLSAFRNNRNFALTRIAPTQVARARQLGQLYHQSARVRAGWEAPRPGRVGRTAALPLRHLPVFRQQGVRPLARAGVTQRAAPVLPGRAGSVARTVHSGPLARSGATRGPMRARPLVVNRFTPGRVGTPGRVAPHVVGRPAVAAPRRVNPAPAVRRSSPIVRPAPAFRGVRRPTPAARPAARPFRAAARPAPRPVRAAARPAPRPAARPAPRPAARPVRAAAARPAPRPAARPAPRPAAAHARGGRGR